MTGQDRAAGAELLEHARAGNDAAQGEHVGTVDREGAVVYHIADDGASRAAVAELQRASADDRATGIGVRPAQDQRAGALFGNSDRDLSLKMTPEIRRSVEPGPSFTVSTLEAFGSLAFALIVAALPLASDVAVRSGRTKCPAPLIEPPFICRCCRVGSRQRLPSTLTFPRLITN